ncbi:MAG TPA: ATP-binding cassette domain-containing protein, partial [Dongiaceae bacterium]|nr:ATP-binding cassette domain-containing protein [Dongiaceae bacterium]
ASSPLPPPTRCQEAGTKPSPPLALRLQELALGRPFLSLAGAAFRLGEGIVFENTSWVFHRDEHWAIIGANGSGKSLLADAVRGRLPLAQGRLRYHFRAPPGLMPEEAIGQVSFEVRKGEAQGAVMQSRWNSFEEESGLRVRDFLAYERVMEANPFEVTGRHEQARRRFERRRRRAVGLLRVEPFLERTLISLSNGERQRVELARALCHPLRLLILDDPFVGLDSGMRQHFELVLESLMRTRLRVLLITTRLEELPPQVTHLLCVDRCRVVAAGPRAEMLSLVLPGQQARCLLHVAAGPRAEILSMGPSKSWLAPTRPIRAGNGGRRGASAALRARGAPKSGAAAAGDCELVRLRDVTLRYGQSTILEGIDWTVRAGESWALLGPNGSGKTALLSLILGDNPQAYANEVVVFGRRRGTGESIWEIKRRIGSVSPELHLHFNDAVTCFEVVVSGFHDTVGLFHEPSARQRALARRWLARFGLSEFARSPLFALSAGLQRMVLLARALVKGPRLLLLDEPCQGLDPAHRQVFVKAVDDLVRDGAVTAIYVTHRQEEIPPSIRRVLRLGTFSEQRLGGLQAIAQRTSSLRPMVCLPACSAH